MSLSIALAERRLVPDALIRVGIRQLLAERLRDEGSPAGRAREAAYVAGLVNSPLAIRQDAANAQHYEVPASFYATCLGRRFKYSSGWWDATTPDLDAAEEAMLARSVAHAGLADGMDILEIGCGWGSLTLYMAERFPHSRILAISNSNSQRAFITARAAERGLANVTVRTIDVCDFTHAPASFDRVVSVECFEHLRNYALLLQRIAGWLRPDGRLWFHIFVHRTFTYPFEGEGSGSGDWMSRHFFTGGQMPGFDLMRRFSTHLEVEDMVAVPGTHYGRTAEAWLAKVDANAAAALTALADHPEPQRQLQRWRIFFMACAELWNYADGQEWLVGHYRMRPVE